MTTTMPVGHGAPGRWTCATHGLSFGDPCCAEAQSLAVVQAEGQSVGHAFLPVNGHPDDDECTYRSDGTDATYCGLTQREHEADHGAS